MTRNISRRGEVRRRWGWGMVLKSGNQTCHEACLGGCEMLLECLWWCLGQRSRKHGWLFIPPFYSMPVWQGRILDQLLWQLQRTVSMQARGLWASLWPLPAWPLGFPELPPLPVQRALRRVWPTDRQLSALSRPHRRRTVPEVRENIKAFKGVFSHPKGIRLRYMNEGFGLLYAYEPNC